MSFSCALSQKVLCTFTASIRACGKDGCGGGGGGGYTGPCLPKNAVTEEDSRTVHLMLSLHVSQHSWACPFKLGDLAIRRSACLVKLRMVKKVAFSVNGKRAYSHTRGRN